MIDIIYAALPMCAPTEKTTFSFKDDQGKSLHVYKTVPGPSLHNLSCACSVLCKGFVSKNYNFEDKYYAETNIVSSVRKEIRNTNKTCCDRYIVQINKSNNFNSCNFCKSWNQSQEKEYCQTPVLSPKSTLQSWDQELTLFSPCHNNNKKNKKKKNPHQNLSEGGVLEV